MFLASTLFLCLVDPVPEEQGSFCNSEEDSTFCETIVDTWRLTISRKMMLVNPGSAMTGLSIAFYVGLFVPIIVLQQQNDPDYSKLTPDE